MGARNEANTTRAFCPHRRSDQSQHLAVGAQMKARDVKTTTKVIDLMEALKASLEKHANASLYDNARRVIRAGIVAARARGLKVRPGTIGVDYGEASSMWFEDLFQEGFTPIGLVLLEKFTEADEQFEAASEVLSVGTTWIIGVDDGWCGQDHATEHRHAGALYQDGFEFGQQLRKEFLR